VDSVVAVSGSEQVWVARVVAKGSAWVNRAADHVELELFAFFPDHFSQGMAVAVQTENYSQKYGCVVFGHIKTSTEIA